MALVIGFANFFYTLWDVGTTERYEDEGRVHVGTNYHFHYIKNISRDLDKAKALYPDLEVNEDLRGKTGSFDYYSRVDRPITEFSFGMLEGKEISSATDLWQLMRAMDEERPVRRRVLARRRLIELGHLVRYVHYVSTYPDLNWGKRDDLGNLLPEDRQEVKHRVNYATQGFVDQENARKRALAVEYLFQDGEKVELSIKEIEQFFFDTQYGRSYVRVYITENGDCFKYVGKSPLMLSNELFTKVRATIKHKEYRGLKETHLLRMKLLP